MFKLSLIGGLVIVGVLGIAGCDRRPSEPAVPKAELEQRERLAFPDSPDSDPSLPSASLALSRVDEKAPDMPPATLHVAPLKPVSESTAMPLGGQNNDHSAPKATDPVPPSPAVPPLR